MCCYLLEDEILVLSTSEVLVMVWLVVVLRDRWKSCGDIDEGARRRPLGLGPLGVCFSVVGSKFGWAFGLLLRSIILLMWMLYL